MRCCILEKPGLLRVDDVADPTADSGDLVIRVRAALTCGTDLKAYRRGHPKMPCPTPFGHEFAGEIVEVGSGVDGFAVGDAVMSANTGPCGHCFFCRREQENLCESLMDAMILGAYAEYLRIPARVVRCNVFQKPEAIPFAEAALLEPLSSVCFGLAQVPASARREEATALLIGAGPIALLWLVALKAEGVGRVIVAGRRAPRLRQAAALGADLTIGEGDDVAHAVLEATGGRGADVVVECTGLPEVWEQAPTYARRGGSVVLFGGCPGTTRASFDTYRLHYDGVSITSPFHFRPRDVRAAHALLVRPDIDWSAFITLRCSLDAVPAVFERLGEGTDVKCAVLPHGD
jgi:L-iditol 2-dehydrogenase